MVLSGWEAVFFWVFAIAALVAGLLMIMARNAVHCALFLISSLISIAALFILLGAEFIAGVQILVYVGGVMVLFLFVIMLVNVGAEERGRERIFNSQAQVVATTVFAVLLALGLVVALNQGYNGLRDRDRIKIRDAADRRAAGEQSLPGEEPSATGTFRITKDTERVGSSLYRYASLPFEIASVLLLVAIIGSVMLARTVKQEVAADDLDPEELKGSDK
ncbi:MAG TPA: NADH-quinone oxidoreductase subunit J [Pyrinomonadaceae bacterium]|nr:NADH-quinone oxidoreductase subunit J [Pyrinomonadaceae bacterium]